MYVHHQQRDPYIPRGNTGIGGEEISDRPPLLSTTTSRYSDSSVLAHTEIPQEAIRPSLRNPKRLILCFDGTAESFEGNSADSNVVKLYSKFDRTEKKIT